MCDLFFFCSSTEATVDSKYRKLNSSGSVNFMTKSSHTHLENKTKQKKTNNNQRLDYSVVDWQSRSQKKKKKNSSKKKKKKFSGNFELLLAACEQRLSK